MSNPVCQGLNGYATQGAGNATYTDPAGVTAPTTWGAISDATGTFYAKSEIKGDCKVKDWVFTGKGPPKFELYKVVGSASGMKRDQCSLYTMASQLHWTLEQGDRGKAYLEAQQIRTDVEKLIVAGEVDATKGAQIRTAATAVERCVYFLLSAN
jgi:hypothetical protein